MKSYRGRSVTVGQLVDVYRNLHTSGYSVRDAKTGLVLVHCDSVLLHSCSFKIQESGRIKTIEQKRKRVHAWIRGIFVSADEQQPSDFTNIIYYNPYVTSKFWDSQTNSPIDFAEEVYCAGKFAYSVPNKLYEMGIRL